jgi:CcmD family protein
MGFLWCATAVVWGGTLVYMFRLVKKQERLERELAALEKMLEDIATVDTDSTPLQAMTASRHEALD